MKQDEMMDAFVWCNIIQKDSIPFCCIAIGGKFKTTTDKVYTRINRMWYTDGVRKFRAGYKMAVLPVE